MVFSFISFQRCHSPEIQHEAGKRQADREEDKQREKMSDSEKIIDATNTTFHQALVKSVKERLEHKHNGVFKGRLKQKSSLEID